MLDVLIIGAGAVGCAIARELSRYKLNIAVLEKNSDVAGETTGRNSAVVHAGFNNKPGSLMAKLCVEGNEGFGSLCEELGVPFDKTGKLIVALEEEDEASLEKIISQGKANGCKGLKIINRDEMRNILPGVDGYKAMYSPQTGITNPFLYCVALAENALANGVSFHLNTCVTGMDRACDGSFLVQAGGRVYQSRLVINCAGLGGDKICQMVGINNYKIYPCRGEYFLLDKDKEGLLPLPVYPAPKVGIGGLGVHLTPTSEGNVIIGPSAEYINETDDYSSTAKIMDKLLREAKQLMPSVERIKPIGNYCGIRPKLAPPNEGGYRDFVIKEEPACPGFINLMGIESPGLTASLPIARMVAEIVKGKLPSLQENEKFNGRRKAPVQFRKLTREEQRKLIQEDPEYGDIVCRCQKISRREIRDAIENPLGARTISSIKYRAWPTTGRCNGGYCLPKIIEMLINDYGMDPSEILYRNEGSEMLTGFVKGGGADENL